MRTVSKGVQLYRERVHGSLLIITHSTRILEALTVDAAHIMEQGVIVEQNTAEAFFNDPQQPRTKEFLQTYKQRSLL